MRDVSRLRSLDGLRGLAALVVVIHHSLLTIPVLAAPYFTGRSDLTPPWAAVILFTPGHIPWLGTEAVYVFFLLSGFVLTRWVREEQGFSWLGYGASRIVRLYGPSIAAVFFAWATIILVPRTGGLPGLWLGSHDYGYTPKTFLQDVILVTGDSGVVTPLWSLLWEVLFSALLPLAVLLARLRRPALLMLGCAVVVTTGFALGIGILSYLPMFMVGAILAQHRSEAHELVQSMLKDGRGRWLTPLAVVFTLFLLCSNWLLLPLLGGSLARVVSAPLILVGGLTLVVAAMEWQPLVHALTRRAVAGLGTISFSLYLTHEPVIVAGAYLSNAAPWAIPISAVLAIGVAIAFWWLIERHIHSLSRWIKARLTSGPRPRA